MGDPRANEADIRAILSKSPSPIDTIVETGTHLCEGTLLFSRIFEQVYSIELMDALYNEALKKCLSRNNITLMHGDSAEIVPDLARKLKNPVYWYLDAHWFIAPGGVKTAESFPLWDELEYVCQRPHEEIIVVDDVHAFGLQRPQKWYGPWKGTTQKTIHDFIAKRKEVVKCEVVKDEFVLYVK